MRVCVYLMIVNGASVVFIAVISRRGMRTVVSPATSAT